MALSPIRRLRIRLRFLAGHGSQDIAKDFGVARTTVGRNTKGLQAGTGVNIPNLLKLKTLWDAEAGGIDLDTVEFADLVMVLEARLTGGSIGNFARSIIENEDRIKAEAN